MANMATIGSTLMSLPNPDMDGLFELIAKNVSDGDFESAAAIICAQPDGFEAADCMGNLLHYAVFAKNLGLVKWLLASGVAARAVDHRGLTPLMLACEEGNEDIVRILLANDPARLEDECHGGLWFRHGRNLLQLAAASGNTCLVEYLIEQGGDIHHRAVPDRWPKVSEQYPHFLPRR